MNRNESVLTKIYKDKTVVFIIRGEIDHHSLKNVKTVIDSEIFVKRPDKLTLDLSGVNFMDSSGLGLILGRYQLATRLGIGFSLLEPSPAVSKLVKLAGCEKIINIERKSS